jgi:uncharacterized membrane protein
MQGDAGLLMVPEKIWLVITIIAVINNIVLCSIRDRR